MSLSVNVPSRGSITIPYQVNTHSALVTQDPFWKFVEESIVLEYELNIWNTSKLLFEFFQGEGVQLWQVGRKIWFLGEGFYGI